MLAADGGVAQHQNPGPRILRLLFVDAHVRDASFCESTLHRVAAKGLQGVAPAFDVIRDASEALQLVKRVPYDLIIISSSLDIDPAAISAFEAAQALVEMDVHVPLALVTADRSGGLRRKADGIFDALLHPPLTSPALVEVISSLCLGSRHPFMTMAYPSHHANQLLAGPSSDDPFHQSQHAGSAAIGGNVGGDPVTATPLVNGKRRREVRVVPACPPAAPQWQPPWHVTAARGELKRKMGDARNEVVEKLEVKLIKANKADGRGHHKGGRKKR